MTAASTGHRAPPRGMRQDGPAILSYGFRPFFLGAGIWAALALSLWLAALDGRIDLGGAYGPVLWHAHEMLFGFAPAVLAGFLLTAVPNWTGSLPIAGRPLLGLVGLWIAGRIGMAGAGVWGQPVAAGLDLLFLPALLVLVGREIIAGRKWNDLKVLAGVGMVLAANLWFHLAVLLGGAELPAFKAAIAGFTALVLIIGGRIIPSFTRNWLAQRKQALLPVAYNRFDKGVIAASVPALALWVLLPDGPLTCVAAVLAGGLNGVRLMRWRGLAVWGEKLLFVLHVAYLMVPLGFLSIAAAAIGWLSPQAALHVLTIGVVGGMMLAMMTRVALGHTGRALTASRLTVLSYLCLFAAALLRPLADALESGVLMQAAGGAFVLAFALYVLEYASLLLRARRKPLERDR